MFFTQISDYFLLGDLHTAALVSNRGSIDWLCLPNFDSPSVFAKILDKDAGSFSVMTEGFTVKSQYLGDTAIVNHVFTKGEFSFSLDDFMVPQAIVDCQNHLLVRKFIGRFGRGELSFIFHPRPDYGRGLPDILYEDSFLSCKLNGDTLFLHLPKNSRIRRLKDKVKITIDLAAREEKNLILEYRKRGVKAINKAVLTKQKTEKFWRDWVKRGTFFDFCRRELIRSAITLKLMQFYPTGAIIAAPTTSLPEVIGGVRNWDYRYTWIRDATFTLYAFYVLGYLEEAERFFEFIDQVMKDFEQKDRDLYLMYTIWGGRVPQETELPHLSGYKDSSPVRIGNGATEQFQLDTYGSLIDALYFISNRKIESVKKYKRLLLHLAKKIEENWLNKDNGIWEMRTTPKHFTYSKVMAWVGIDRVVRMSERIKLKEADRKNYLKLARKINSWIWKQCYDEKRKAFRQYPETTAQDATNFLFIPLQFINRHDPRAKTVIDNTCQELCYKDGYVYRYRAADGLMGEEGAFLLCTFWLISALAQVGEIKKARKIFNQIRKQMAKSTLLSEELDPNAREYLGNFPQAFPHMGFIMSAFYLHKYGNR